MKIEITPAQLEAIKNLADDADSMIGGGDYLSDMAWRRYVKLIDRMLEKNGQARHNRHEENAAGSD